MMVGPFLRIRRVQVSRFASVRERAFPAVYRRFVAPLPTQVVQWVKQALRSFEKFDENGSIEALANIVAVSLVCGDDMRAAGMAATSAAYAGWTDTARERIEADMAAGGAVRGGRAAAARGDVADGRADVAEELDKPFGEHAARTAPIIGDWLAGRIYGSARNAAPDAPEARRDPFAGDAVMGP